MEKRGRCLSKRRNDDIKLMSYARLMARNLMSSSLSLQSTNLLMLLPVFGLTFSRAVFNCQTLGTLLPCVLLRTNFASVYRRLRRLRGPCLGRCLVHRSGLGAGNGVTGLLLIIFLGRHESRRSQPRNGKHRLNCNPCNIAPKLLPFSHILTNFALAT